MQFETLQKDMIAAMKEHNKARNTDLRHPAQLEKIVAVQNGNGIYVRRYGLTKRQRKILEAFGISDAYLNKAVAKLNKVS